MIGILAALIISWLLLWFFEKKHITALGIGITGSRMRDLGWGFAGAAVCCVVYHLLSRFHWKWNASFSLFGFFKSTWWVLKSVLFEEIVFRGALLFIAIKKIGVTKACWLSAICFGVYHIFSYQVFGSVGTALLVFFMTGVVGLALAYAFAYTKSLYLPIGLHVGWNLINIIVFSSGPLGAQLFVKGSGGGLQGTYSLLVFIFQIVALPLFVWWYIAMFHKNKKGSSQQ